MGRGLKDTIGILESSLDHRVLGPLRSSPFASPNVSRLVLRVTPVRPQPVGIQTGTNPTPCLPTRSDPPTELGSRRPLVPRPDQFVSSRVDKQTSTPRTLSPPPQLGHPRKFTNFVGERDSGPYDTPGNPPLVRTRLGDTSTRRRSSLSVGSPHYPRVCLHSPNCPWHPQRKQMRT